MLDEPGLYAVHSISGSVYYVDSRDVDAPGYLRARSTSEMTLSSHMDDAWHDLVMLRPVTDVAGAAVLLDVPWVLLLGHGHCYETRRPGHPNGDVYWVASSDCTRLERLEQMPPPDDLTTGQGWDAT